jgi:hypothetical protein
MGSEAINVTVITKILFIITTPCLKLRGGGHDTPSPLA